MSEQILHNIAMVRDEAEHMLENVRAIKGNEYAQLLSALMHAKNLVALWSFVLKSIKLSDKSYETIDKAFMNTLEQMITAFLSGMQLDSQNYVGAVKDAEVFERTISEMMHRAMKGEQFGDKA